jgi:hypothetical protein
MHIFISSQDHDICFQIYVFIALSRECNHAAGSATQTVSGTIGVCSAQQVAGTSYLVVNSASTLTMSIYVVAIAVFAGLFQLLAL